jgi:hypothetical protein
MSEVSDEKPVDEQVVSEILKAIGEVGILLEACQAAKEAWHPEGEAVPPGIGQERLRGEPPPDCSFFEETLAELNDALQRAEAGEPFPMITNPAWLPEHDAFWEAKQQSLEPALRQMIDDLNAERETLITLGEILSGAGTVLGAAGMAADASVAEAPAGVVLGGAGVLTGAAGATALRAAATNKQIADRIQEVINALSEEPANPMQEAINALSEEPGPLRLPVADNVSPLFSARPAAAEQLRIYLAGLPD